MTTLGKHDDDVDEVRGHYRAYLAERCYQMLVLKKHEGADAIPSRLAVVALVSADAFIAHCDAQVPALKPWERAGW